MVLRKLLSGTAGRLFAVLSVFRHALSAFARGHPIRALGLVAVAVLAWKWAVVALVAEGLVRVLRPAKEAVGEESNEEPSPSA